MSERYAEHLSGFDCERCGHSAMAHYRNPGCRRCPCNNDPVCWCGALGSKHTTAAAQSPTPPITDQRGASDE